MSLITNISQIKSASTINFNSILSTWQPYIEEAEQFYIRPYIDESFYLLLDAEVNGSGSGPTKYDQPLEKVRVAIALYALYLGADEISVSISAQGIQTIQTDSHRPAMQYQIQNLKESWLARANRNVDIFLKWMDDHQDDYPEYHAIDAGLFLRNAREFQKFIDIRESRRVFIALKPIMLNIEKKYILPTISKEYFDELKEKLNGSGSEEMASDDQAVIDLIKPALAHLTLARGLREMSIDILDWGIFETSGNSFDRIMGKAIANQDRVSVMFEANLKDGESDLKALQEYLDTYASDNRYITYYNSSRRIDPSVTPEERDRFNNKDGRAFFLG
jgi:hypothetical protein